MFIALVFGLNAQQIAVLKYDGGGDWYANPTALPNLARFCNQQLGTRIPEKVAEVSFQTEDVFNYPFIHMTGHGNVVFSADELDNLRKYLRAGGFLHIDDNYGMDPFIRPQLLALFPDAPLEQLMPNDPIFKLPFDMPEGLPKIHAHDEKPSEAWCIRLNGRIVLLYTFEADLGDGWEDQEVHNDPQEKREQALRMGANIVAYAFSNRFHVTQ